MSTRHLNTPQLLTPERMPGMESQTQHFLLTHKFSLSILIRYNKDKGCGVHVIQSKNTIILV